MDCHDLILLANLDADERRALAGYRRTGFTNAFSFPAPAGCRSLEEWARAGDERWARLKAKLRQLQPTAHSSQMVAA
jgi:hypothetical protein